MVQLILAKYGLEKCLDTNMAGVFNDLDFVLGNKVQCVRGETLRYFSVYDLFI